MTDRIHDGFVEEMKKISAAEVAFEQAMPKGILFAIVTFRGQGESVSLRTMPNQERGPTLRALEEALMLAQLLDGTDLDEEEDRPKPTIAADRAIVDALEKAFACLAEHRFGLEFYDHDGRLGFHFFPGKQEELTNALLARLEQGLFEISEGKDMFDA